MRTSANRESRWAERIARARTLAVSHPAASEALTFYAAVAEYQRSLLTKAPTDQPAETRSRDSEAECRSFVEALDLDPVLDAIPDFLSCLPQAAPPRLAASIS